MTPLQQQVLQWPLMAVVTPIQAVGSTAMRSIYWGTALDTPAHVVDLYVTDPSRAAALIAAARKRDPGLDTSLIRVMRTAYSMATLTAAGKRVLAADLAGRLPFKLIAVGQLDRGASLRLQVTDAAQARRFSYVPLKSLGGRSLTELAGVRLTFQQVYGAGPLSRENDSLPFIGGDGLRDPLTGEYCSGGIAVENSSGRDFLITAAHCFPSGDTVTTFNGTTHVGIPYRYNLNYDAEIIDTGKSNGAGTNADEGEYNTPGGGIKYYLVTGVNAAWSVGQVFCQDGVFSYDDGYGVPCNLRVSGTVTDAFTGANGAETVTEIEANSDNGSPTVVFGDSGAVVFNVVSATARYAAGLQSYGKDCTNDHCQTTDFVWAQNFLAPANVFGYPVHLNPHT
jgi:hypothetical protein